jgi:hypothetical protein
MHENSKSRRLQAMYVVRLLILGVTWFSALAFAIGSPNPRAVYIACIALFQPLYGMILHLSPGIGYGVVLTIGWIVYASMTLFTLLTKTEGLFWLSYIVLIAFLFTNVVFCRLANGIL